MTDTTTPPLERAATMAELQEVTGWGKDTIYAAIRQGVLPGTAFQVEGSSQYVYSVPWPALRLWQQNPTQFSPRPVPMVRKVRQSA